MSEWTVSSRVLERLRGLCLALPEASEKVAWGDPTWRVRDRIFAMQKGNYAGGRPSLWLKAEPGAQEALVGARPSLFFVPPYVGHKGWIGIYLDGARLDWDVVKDLVVDSYRWIAGPRLASRLTEVTASDATPVPPTRKKAPRARKTTPPVRKKEPRTRKKTARARRKSAAHSK